MNKFSDNNYQGETHQRGSDWIDRRELGQIWRQLRGIKSQDNSTLTVVHGPDGPTLWVPGRGVPVLVQSGSGEDHVAHVYGHGKDGSVTESNAPIKVLQIAAGQSIPRGTWLMASKMTWSTGSSSASYWTVDVTRWY